MLNNDISVSCTYLENFSDWHDASNYLERHLDEIPNNWSIYNASINYINNRWRVGLCVGPSQLSLDLNKEE